MNATTGRCSLSGLCLAFCGFVVCLVFVLGICFLFLVRLYDLSIRLPRSLVRHYHTQLRWTAKPSSSTASDAKKLTACSQKNNMFFATLIH